MDDTRARFLSAIVAQLGAERIVELHLFSPIRQGTMETGVAVVAALPDLEPPSAQEQAQWSAGEEAERSAGEAVAAGEAAAVETPAESRHVVLTARYRLTRKGADRGKWAFELAATADAPLATVDMVVRGVMYRSKDLTETERLSGEQVRVLLAEPAWRTTP